jgi:hypothetical protein
MKLQTALRTIMLITIVLASTLVEYGGSAIHQGVESVLHTSNSYLESDKGQIALATYSSQTGILVVMR